MAGQTRPGSGPGNEGVGDGEATQLSAPRAGSTPGRARPPPPPPALLRPLWLRPLPGRSVRANHVSASGSGSRGPPPPRPF